MLKIKTIIIAIFATMFVAFSAMATSISMGLTGSVMMYEADGHEKVKSSGTKNNHSEDGTVGFASIFIEGELPTGTVVGIDVIPYSSKIGDASNAIEDVDLNDDSDTAGTNKVDVTVSNAIMVYIEQPVDIPGLSDFANPYVKLGYQSIDLETDENLDTDSTYGDSSTEAIHVGLGLKGDVEGGGFWKAGLLYGMYDGATFTGSTDADSVNNTVELEDMTTWQLRLSVGQSF